MEHTKPQVSCKECKKPLLRCKSPHGVSNLGRFCDFKCKSKRAKIKNLSKLIKKDNNIPYKSTIKRLAIQLNDTKFKPSIKIDKEKMDRDLKYLAFVRSFPCMICGNQSVSHHSEAGGMGLKGSDYSAINVCSFHHTEGGSSVHRIGNEEFENIHNIDIKDQQIQLLREYIRRLNEISIQTR